LDFVVSVLMGLGTLITIVFSGWAAYIAWSTPLERVAQLRGKQKAIYAYGWGVIITSLGSTILLALWKLGVLLLSL
jgi:hypothetical protein